jgi:hypothetical protein
VYTAWSEWAGWRGPPELVAQIARAALWAVSGGTCSIELHVAGDVERFADPDDFLAHATHDGLRRFGRLDIRVSEGDADVQIRLSPHNVKLGRPGVIVLASAGERERAERMRDAVAASVDRRTGRNRRFSGMVEGVPRLLFIDLIDHPSRYEQTVAERRHRLGRQFASDEPVEEGRLARGWRALVDPFASDQRMAAELGLDESPAIRWTRYVWQAVLVVWASAFVLALTGDPGSGDLASWGSGLVVAFAVLGAATWALFRWIRPQVEVTPTSRLQQILMLAWKGLLAAAVSAAVGKSIELLLG